MSTAGDCSARAHTIHQYRVCGCRQGSSNACNRCHALELPTPGTAHHAPCKLCRYICQCIQCDLQHAVTAVILFCCSKSFESAGVLVDLTPGLTIVAYNHLTIIANNPHDCIPPHDILHEKCMISTESSGITDTCRVLLLLQMLSSPLITQLCCSRHYFTTSSDTIMLLYYNA